MYEPSTPEEKHAYASLTRLVMGNGSSLDNASLVSLLNKSQLDREVLRDVWSEACNNKPQPGLPELYALLRCVALAQHNFPFQKSTWPKTNLIPLIPTFVGISLEKESEEQESTESRKEPVENKDKEAAGGMASEVTGRIGGEESPWAMTSGNRQQYEAIFLKQKLVDGKLDGQEAVQFFTQSRMDRDKLRQVWNLSDVDNDGKLTKDEFCIAMHIIMCVTRKNLPVPQQLPPELKPNVTHIRTPHVLQEMRPGSPAGSIGSTGSHSRSFTPDPSTPRHSLSRNFSGQMLDPYPPSPVHAQRLSGRFQEPFGAESIPAIVAANQSIDSATSSLNVMSAKAREEQDRIRKEIESLQAQTAQRNIELEAAAKQLEAENAALSQLLDEVNVEREQLDKVRLEVQSKQTELAEVKERLLTTLKEKITLVAQREALNLQATQLDGEITQANQTLAEASALSLPPAPSSLDPSSPQNPPQPARAAPTRQAPSLSSDSHDSKTHVPRRHAPTREPRSADSTSSSPASVTHQQSPGPADLTSNNSVDRSSANLTLPSRSPPPPTHAPTREAPNTTVAQSEEAPADLILSDTVANNIPMPSRSPPPPARAAPVLESHSVPPAQSTGDQLFPADDDAVWSTSDPFASMQTNNSAGNENKESPSPVTAATTTTPFGAEPEQGLKQIDSAFSDAGFDANFDFDAQGDDVQQQEQPPATSTESATTDAHAEPTAQESK